MSEQLARIEAKRATLAGAGTDPIAGQGTPGGPSAFPAQSARMAAITRRKEELQAEMDRSASEYQAETANNWQFPDTAEATQASMGGPPAQQTPQRQTDPAMPSAPDMPVGQYLSETAGNVPGSIEALGQGIWDAASNPVETARGLGGTVIGAAQHLKDYLGVPTNEFVGDWRPEAAAAGQHYADRYGGTDAALKTLRTDPAGTALDVLGLGTGGIAAGTKAATLGARAGRHVMDIDPPAPKPPRQPRPQTPSRREFIEAAPSSQQLKAAGGALFQAAENAGVRFPSSAYTPAVDRLSTTLMREGLDATLHPKVSRVHTLMNESAGNNPGLSDLMVLRKQFGAAAKSLDADERRLASIAIEKLDDFVEAGDSATAGTLREGPPVVGEAEEIRSYRKGDGTGGGCSIRAGKRSPQ